MQLTTSVVFAMLAAFSAASPIHPINPADPLDPPDRQHPGKYIPGECGVHVTQWRKNIWWNEVGDNYQFDVTIKDGYNRWLNATLRLAIPDLQTVNVYSDLPAPLKITAGVVDSDPVTFEYIGFLFSTSQKQHCNTGKYDQDNRDSEYISASPPRPSARPFVRAISTAIRASSTSLRLRDSIWTSFANVVIVDCGFNCD
jgi:hypothetical protein